MKTKQKYYHLIKPIIFVLFLSFSMASCEKEDIIPESPDIEDTENIMKKKLSGLVID